MAEDIQVTVGKVLLQVKSAIETAWDDTREQVTGFDRRILHTCFGQFLLGNVMHRIHELNGACPSAHVDLKLNRKRSAYHIELTTQGILCTIFSVRDAGDLPRYAHFRAAIANSLQSFFAYAEEERAFKFYPPNPIDKSLRSYIQILHGPKDNREHREELGFIRVAFLDRLHGEQWRVTTISKLLEALEGESTIVESDLPDILSAKDAPTEEIPDLVSDQLSLLNQDIQIFRPIEDGGA